MMISELQSDLERFVSEAELYIEDYEGARRMLASLKGEPYEPRIEIVAKLPERPAKTPRKMTQYVRVTPEQLRDWAVGKGRSQGRFTRPEMVEELGVSASTAASKSNELVKRGWFSPERNGRTLVYSYVPPQAGGGPQAPAKQKRGRSNGSTAVPGTGRPAGPAPTPGALKRQQRKAKIVKPKPVKGVRV